MRADGRGQAWWWPAVPAAGFGLVGVSALDAELLGRSGLASVGVAALFALFLGGPLARADWHRGEPVGTGDRWAAGLVDTAVVGSMGAAVAGVLPGGFAGLGAACAVWAGAAVIGGFRRLGGLVLVAALGWAGAAVFGITAAAPWGLLEPAFHTAPTWLGVAVGIGALLSWAPGRWEAAAGPAPARGNAPWLAVGVGLLGLTLAAVVHASGWERALGGPVGPGVTVLRAVSLGVAAGCMLQGEPTGRDRALRIGWGLVATGWFAITGSAGFWWGATLPVLLGAVCALRAAAGRDVLQAVAAITLVGAAFVSIPPTPGMVLAGGALAIPAVVAVWVAGTRALVGRAA